MVEARLIERRFLSAQEQCALADSARRRCVLLFLLLRTCSLAGVPGERGAVPLIKRKSNADAAGCCRGLINPACIHLYICADGWMFACAPREIHYVHYRVGKDYLCTFVCLPRRAQCAVEHIHARDEIHNALAELPLVPVIAADSSHSSITTTAQSHFFTSKPSTGVECLVRYWCWQRFILNSSTSRKLICQGVQN